MKEYPQIKRFTLTTTKTYLVSLEKKKTKPINLQNLTIIKLKLFLKILLIFSGYLIRIGFEFYI